MWTVVVPVAALQAAKMLLGAANVSVLSLRRSVKPESSPSGRSYMGANGTRRLMIAEAQRREMTALVLQLTAVAYDVHHTTFVIICT